MKTISIVCAAALLAAPALALDGKWTPGQVLEIDPNWLAEQGLQLPPSALWDGERGTGLLSGTVNIAGCSGAFVSATGLILTNHHCLFGLVQEHSTPERDLISNGFLARSRDAELPGATTRVEFPRRFTDVTADVLSAVPADADALARLTAIEAKQKQLVDKCQQQPDTRCKVAVFDDGVQYTLIESTELRDVRLVYAPPRSIGEYGGEIDNWMWPRHTGDFAIARAYVAEDGRPADHSASNRPYQPEFHFKISDQGLSEGDFLMILGYPGITYRALIAEEMRERRERFFVRREELFGEWVEHLQQASAADPAAAIAVASNVKSILNRYKNAQGQIAGLDRGRIIDKQMAHDEAVAAFAADCEDNRPALAARAALREMLAERQDSWERDFLLSLIPLGVETVPGGIPPLPKTVYFGATIAHYAREQSKPDAERTSGFAASDLPRLRERLRREQQNYHEAADQRVFAALVRRALALPEAQHIPAVESRFAGMDAAAIDAAIARMFADTELLSVPAREAMLGQDIEALRERGDALLEFAIDWNADMRLLRQRERERASRAAIHRPIWRRAVAAYGGRPIAPDANSTLRVSFAHVQGYAPRDGVYYTPFTTLSGVLEKYTGNEPFDLPAAVRAAAVDPGARWQQSKLGSVAINFLADGDTSGGNSGSPVVNGLGELVGINFDRVWENVAGDFGFNPALSRNVSVDIRYLLWLLERVESAQELLTELGIQTSSAPDSSPK